MDVLDPKVQEGDPQAVKDGSGTDDNEDPSGRSSENEFAISNKSLSETDSDTESAIVYPSRFEPPATAASTSLQSPSPQAETEECSNNREGNTDWCTCGKCIAMSNGLNCKCCLESQEIQDRVLTFCQGCGDGDKIRCITQHEGFRSVCLDPWVLETAFYQYRQEYPHDGQSAQDLAEKYRHIAYRQFVRWTFGLLGRHSRVVLPSCVMKAIRDSYPNEDGPYVGFKYA